MKNIIVGTFMSTVAFIAMSGSAIADEAAKSTESYKPGTVVGGTVGGAVGADGGVVEGTAKGTVKGVKKGAEKAVEMLEGK